MKRLSLVLLGLVFIYGSCQSTENERNPISEEHAALFGTWEEKDSIKNTTWVFDRYEVKWNGFSHYYKVSGDSLIISGIVYRITDLSEKNIKLMTLNGKPCLLNRKE